MATTHNGWPVDPAVETITVNSVSTTCCAGDVTLVMQWVAEQWNKRIESVALMRAYRSKAENDDLPNSIPNSNHISGTANDINWNIHPFGVPGTFSNSQLDALRSIEKQSGGVVAFGEFFPQVYGSTVDPTHVEIRRGITPAQVAAFADTITLEVSVPPEDDDDMRIIRRNNSSGTAFAWDAMRYWPSLGQGTVNALVAADIPYKVLSTGDFDTIVNIVTADTSSEVPADILGSFWRAAPPNTGGGGTGPAFTLQEVIDGVYEKLKSAQRGPFN